MKKTLLFFMILSLMVFVGCNKVDGLKGLNKEAESHPTENSKVASNQSTEQALKHLENRDFFIQGKNLSDEGDEKIIEFGKAFVNLYNGAVAEQEVVSFEKYITNKNLREYTDKTLELTQKLQLQGSNAVNYGFKNEFREAKIKPIEDHLCYLELLFEFKGSGMTYKMLITTENKALKIVDLYFGIKDGVDTYATGHPAERTINNPNLWDDEEWVKGVFKKLEDFQKRMGS